MILAIDPGETSGICFFKSAEDFETDTVYKSFEGIVETILKYDPSLVVFERFTLYPSHAQAMIYDEMYTSQVIGVIKYICEKEGIPYHVQSASNKNYVVYPDDHKFPSEHEKDAYGHAWYLDMSRKK